MVMDLADMAAGGGKGDNDGVGESLKDLIWREVDLREPVKGFGKMLVRLFQRMDLRKVVLAAKGELCTVLLKLYDALGAGIATDVWLLHPVLSTGFVNGHLVPMGEQERRRLVTTRSNGNGENSKPTQMHLVFQDDATRDKMVSMPWPMLWYVVLSCQLLGGSRKPLEP
jgi:hypothetical protein